MSNGSDAGPSDAINVPVSPRDAPADGQGAKAGPTGGGFDVEDPMVEPLRTCAGCTSPLGRGVVYSRMDGGTRREICFRCLHDHLVVAPSHRGLWAETEAPYMRLLLIVPGEPVRILEVTDKRSIVVGRKSGKFERLRAQLLTGPTEVDYVFEEVKDKRVGGIHAMLNFSTRTRTFRVFSYAKDKRKTFCDRPITAKATLINGAKTVQGFYVLAEMEYYHLMFRGTRVLLVNPDDVVGDVPRLVVDEIRGCQGLEGFRQVMDTTGFVDLDSEEQRADSQRVWNFESTQTASNRFSFDLGVNVVFGDEGVVSQAVLRPDRSIIFSGARANEEKPELLERGMADPCGSYYASAVPEEIELYLAKKVKSRHKNSWTHVYRVPVVDEHFLGPLFLVRYLSEKSMYVMIPINANLQKTRRSEPFFRTVVAHKTHEFFVSMQVNAGGAQLTVVAFKRIPITVYPPRVAFRTATSITLEWLPAESPAPIVRYEIWEKSGAVALASVGVNLPGRPAGPTSGAGRRRSGDVTMVDVCEGLVRSLRIPNLRPSTCYELYLKAVTDDGGIKSAIVRAATNAMPDALDTGLSVDLDRMLPSSSSLSPGGVVWYPATYGSTPLAVAEYRAVDMASDEAVRLREMIVVLQGLVDHANVAHFFGGTEYAALSADSVVFQLRTEMPMPSVAAIWPAFGAPNVVPHLCREVTFGLAFLHANGIVLRNLCPDNVGIRSTLPALGDDPDSVLDATFAITNFDLAVMTNDLREVLGRPVIGVVRRSRRDSLERNGGWGTPTDPALRQDASSASSPVWVEDSGPVPLPRPRASLKRGDPAYLAPELLTLADGVDPSPLYSGAGDMFSLGVLTLELVLWEPNAAAPPRLYQLMMGAAIENLADGCSLGHGAEFCRHHALGYYKDLVRRLQGASREAPGRGDGIFFDHLSAMWVNEGEEARRSATAEVMLAFLAECLRIDPKDRITARALLHDGSVGDRWFELAACKVDLRCHGLPNGVSRNSTTEGCAACQRSSESGADGSRDVAGGDGPSDRPAGEDVAGDDDPAVVGSDRPAGEDVAGDDDPAVGDSNRPADEDVAGDDDPAVVDSDRPADEDVAGDGDPAVVDSDRPADEESGVEATAAPPPEGVT